MYLLFRLFLPSVLGGAGDGEKVPSILAAFFSFILQSAQLWVHHSVVKILNHALNSQPAYSVLFGYYPKTLNA
jgi:hypothetical protein